MTRRFICILFACFTALTASAQRISPASFKALAEKEDSLRYFASRIIFEQEQERREEACDLFIPKLVQALKTPGSFYYPFDSLRTVSIQYPKDSTFRIFTWALQREDRSFRHYGAIQQKSADGQLKLYPLFDNSDFINNWDTITSPKAWIGCLYYKIVQTQYFNKQYYTLFGWDGNNFRSQKKMMEMLSFETGQPVFGAPMFSFAEDTVRKPTLNRFVLEYKQDVNVSLNYSPDMQKVMYDHLISETNEPGKLATYVPDLDYEGFQWKAGKWVHIEKIFHDALEQGKAPIVAPLDQSKKDLKRIRTDDEVFGEQKAQQEKKKKKN
ncbi:hypothetical protein MKQ68_06755 [Chitinophaga horti]|uniref:Uncharacterized protein n=1 Tax=Chitinophaga horti TaxID=2920382 RepID=A0ABY6J537_9BACT|nr:hypothetical protein [Chitinophaga horti]UYQ94790.1 hypothetical protein MKQ68_06755 [Chitinophaga horti]